jgi:deazaflavin-dependent oxidoreductase (nitroreductase family)
MKTVNNVWYFTPSPRALTWITKIHRRLYRATRGFVGSGLPQLEETPRGRRLRWLTVLLLTTTGRKTATPRTVPLPFYVYEGRTFIVASFAGRDRDPAWYENLVQQPEVEVQWGSRRRRCRAVTLSGKEREHIWTLLADDWPRYGIYQAGTPRQIPVVELIPDD